MRRAVVAILVVLAALTARGQARITSDIEIRQMEEQARKASGFDLKVSAHVNLAALRTERNEPEAAQRELETALQLTRDERDDRRRDLDLQRYARACSWAGVVLAGLGRGPESFAVLEEAVRYSADERGIWNLYSASMSRLGQAEKAIGAARMSVAAAELRLRRTGEAPVARPSPRSPQRRGGRDAPVRALLELNVDRFALAQGLLDSGDDSAADEAEQVLRTITESLDSDELRSLRKSLGKREEFQILTAPTTESGIYLSNFNRAHMRLGQLYESRGLVEKARHEFEVVVSRRSDEPMALAGLARLATDGKERDRYLSLSLDANPFAADVVGDYQRHVDSGNALPVSGSGSVGSRVRLAIQQAHDRDFRRARETLEKLLEAHPNNDLLHALLARAVLQSGDVAGAKAVTASIADEGLRLELEMLLGGVSSARPWFLDRQAKLVDDPSEADLRAVLSLFAANRMPAADLATLDQEEFSSSARFDPPEGGAFEHGTILHVPFRFQTAVRFKGITSAAKPLRLEYRILGATTSGGRDALLLEPIRAEVDE